MKSLMYAYRDRRARKRDMRSLWIVRINAAARQNGLPYNRFISGVQRLGVVIDRKMLADMAVNDPHAFATLAAQVKGVSAPVYVPPVAPAPAHTSARVTPAAAAATETMTFVPVSAATVAEDQPTAELQTAEAVEQEQPAALLETAAPVEQDQPAAELQTVAEEEAEAAGEPIQTSGDTDETAAGGSERQRPSND